MLSGGGSLILSLAALASGQIDPGRLELVRQSHRQSLQGIHSLQTRMELRPQLIGGGASRPRDPVFTEWYQFGEMIRCIRRSGNHTADQFWSGKVMKELETYSEKNKVQRVTGSLGGKRGGISVSSNPWIQGQFRVQLHPERTYDEMLGGAAQIKVVTLTREAGRLLNKVVFSSVVNPGGKSAEHEVLFDPSKNNLVFRAICRCEDYKTTAEVTVFQEVNPGIYFPTEVDVRYYSAGKQVGFDRVRFSNTRINDAIDPSKLALRIPPGTSVADSRSGLIYTIGEDELPVGKAVPLPPASMAEAKRREKDMRRSFLWLWGGGIVSCLVLGFVSWWVWRKRHSAASTA